MKLQTQTIVSLSAVVALGVGAGVAAAVDGSSHASGPPASGQQPIASVPQDVQSRFGVMRAQPSGMPDAIRRSVFDSSSAESRYGANPDLANRVTAGGATMWVVPGGSGMCLFVANPDPKRHPGALGSSACASQADADAGRILMAHLAGPGAPITATYGVVPDGSRVEVTTRRGESHAVPVTSNVYVSHEAQAAKVRVTDSSGTTQETPLPEPANP